MGKQNKEMNAFSGAKKLRETLIDQLKRCNSPEDLERFLKKYNENLKKRNSSITLTAYHQEEINRLDIQINELIGNLRKRFSPVVEIELNPIARERHEEQRIQVDESASLTTTPVLPIESMKEHHPLEQQNEPKVEVPFEKEKAVTRVLAQDKTSLESPPKRVELEREKGGVLKHPKTKHSVRFATLEEEQKPNKDFRDDKQLQETHVDPRIIKQRQVHIFDVRIKLRAIQAKQTTYEEKVKKYQNEKNRKELLKYSKAANAAKSIHVQLSELIDQYVRNGDLISFKSKSQDVLSEKSNNVKTLRTHRGWWEKFLDDLVDLINTGLNRVGSSARMPQLSIFKPLADGGKKVTELNNAISSLKVTV
ncbi:hypothetical protein [Fluoribacter gormanii]|uniref:hypothetical protein n=1 Tax=Fluoribacter gormanii TaxID=464 RepID=UPI001041853E|nr:hypothetical protein [Fluoribacter gormanii]